MTKDFRSNSEAAPQKPTSGKPKEMQIEMLTDFPPFSLRYLLPRRWWPPIKDDVPPR